MKCCGANAKTIQQKTNQKYENKNRETKENYKNGKSENILMGKIRNEITEQKKKKTYRPTIFPFNMAMTMMLFQTKIKKKHFFSWSC